MQPGRLHSSIVSVHAKDGAIAEDRAARNQVNIQPAFSEGYFYAASPHPRRFARVMKKFVAELVMLGIAYGTHFLTI